MDRIKTTLLSDIDPNYETVKIWAAYRQCYSQYGADQLVAANRFGPDFVEKKAGPFIRQCLEKGHESPLEHVQLTFAINGISRVATHQLVRHRIASYSQQSQRYVRGGMSIRDLYTDIENDDALWPVILMLPEDVTEWLINKGELASVLKMYELYSLMLEDNIKAEEARFILPEGSRSKIVVSMNLRSLLNFFHVRLCDSAQDEIREVAAQMAEIVIEEFPWLRGIVGPKCVQDGRCHDGRGYVCSTHYAWRDEEH